MTREEALRRVKRYLTDYIPADNYEEVEEILEALEQNYCEDAISRQAVLDCQHFIYDETGEELEVILAENVLNLPPVTPQPKTGHWIDEFGGCECSECGCLEGGYSDYCPNCGAKMRKIEVEE